MQSNDLSGRHRRLRLEPLEERRLLSAVKDSEPVVFAVFGDYGSGSQYEGFVADMVKGWDPDLIVTTGDNNYGPLAAGDPSWTTNIGVDYGSFILGRSDNRYPEQTSGEQRFFPTVGNHDSYNGPYSGYDGGDISGYLDYFHHDPAANRLPDGVHNAQNSYYDFQWGPIHFFAVDSDHAVVDEASRMAQIQWLQAGLSSSTATWNFVYFHHPPFSSGYHGSSIPMQWPFRQWGADAVFSGHDHDYERVLVDGLPYFVSGVGGASIYEFFRPPIVGSAVRYDQAFGSMRVAVDGELATFEFLSIDDGSFGANGGTVIDTYEIDKSVDTTGPRVIDSSLLEGNVLPDGTLVYTAQFDEQLAGSLDQSDFRLLRQATFPHEPDSFSYDPGTSTLSVQYSGLPADDYTLAMLSGDGAFEDLAGNDLDGEANPLSTVPSGDGIPGGHFLVDFSLREVAVTGRHVFYNNSAFDGDNVLPDANDVLPDADDGAIATDKKALMPGRTASFANYTSYSQGINGIMVDIANPTGTPTAGDFEFTVSSNGEDWVTAEPPRSVTVRPGKGVGDSHRVTITWDDLAIRNRWLRVKVLPTPVTGLAREDVFCFGNAVGESGNSAALFAGQYVKVNAVDVLLARNNPRNAALKAPIDFPYDYDRDRRVNATDMLIARDTQTHLLDALRVISVPPLEAAEGQSSIGERPPENFDWLYAMEFAGADGRPSKKDTSEEETAGEFWW